MDWGKKIQLIEDNLGCKSTELAEKTGVSLRYIVDIKKGRSKNPSSSFIQSLITKLSISPIWLFTDQGPMFLNTELQPSETAKNTEENDEMKKLKEELEALKKEISELEKDNEELDRKNKELSDKLLERLEQLTTLQGRLLGH